MKITIEGEPKEIAALVMELQERQGKSLGQSLEEAVRKLDAPGGGRIQLCAESVFKDK